MYHFTDIRGEKNIQNIRNFFHYSSRLFIGGPQADGNGQPASEEQKVQGVLKKLMAEQR